MISSVMKSAACVLSIAAVVLAVAWGNAAQKRAYEYSLALEQHYSAERAPAIVAAYQKVIQLEPGSKWANQAQVRLDVLQARIRAQQKANEIHRSNVAATGSD